MSFNFEWPSFSETFYVDAREMLAQALNKGDKPPIIAGLIEVKELNMGTVPPELEILEIGDLSTDRFRGIFRLTYGGDAYIVLQTKVQANPLNVPRPSLDIIGAPRILFAAAPLVVPMTLRLSSLSLRAIVVLVVSRQKGITLVFKNDPLESVNVSSSFDGVESVAGYIQREIEGQLREAFRSDLPSIIHRLSQKWLSGEVKTTLEKMSGAKPTSDNISARKGAKLGRNGRPKTNFDRNATIETRTSYLEHYEEGTHHRTGLRTRINASSTSRDSVSFGTEADSTYSTTRQSAPPSMSRSPPKKSFAPSPPPYKEELSQSVPESIVSYDPTYGLRPDSIPLHAYFANYEKLVRTGSTGRGFGDVLGIQEVKNESEDGGREQVDYHRSLREADASLEMAELRDLVQEEPYQRQCLDQDRVHRELHDLDGKNVNTPLGQKTPYNACAAGLETIPAVGGGTITRPRVFHTQSQMRMRNASGSSMSAHGSPSTIGKMKSGEEDSSVSTLGAFSRSKTVGGISLESRLNSCAGMTRSSVNESVPSISRVFTFNHDEGSSSFGLEPSILRHKLLRLEKPKLHSPTPLRSINTSSQASSAHSCTSPEYTQRSPMFRSDSNLAGSSPPSSSPSPTAGQEVVCFPPIRPNAIDYLSRSPSSVLNNSYDDNLPITLNASRNESCAHLTTLTFSNQTLSPFTRSHEHFTARSSPHIINRAAEIAAGGIGRTLAVPTLGRAVGVASVNGVLGGSTNSAVPVKARRKRIHRIGSAKPLAVSVTASSRTSSRSPTVRLEPTFSDVSALKGSSISLIEGMKGRRPPSEMSDYFYSPLPAMRERFT